MSERSLTKLLSFSFDFPNQKDKGGSLKWLRLLVNDCPIIVSS
jgi:hypothetical protein